MKIVINNQKIFHSIDKLIGYHRFIEYHETILFVALTLTAVCATFSFYLAGLLLWVTVVLKAVGYEYALLSTDEEHNNKRNPLKFFKNKWVQKALKVRTTTLTDSEYLNHQKRNIYLAFWLLTLFLIVIAVADVASL